jgi:hypothetical protein
MSHHFLEANYSKAFSYRELEFFTEDEMIEILPKFSLPGDGKIKLFSDSYGPIRSNTKVKIPLWIALSLRQESKCSIIIPSWLSLENLKVAVSGNDPPHPLPEFYEQLSKLLLFHCRDSLNTKGEINDTQRVFDLLRRYHLRHYLSCRERLLKSEVIESFIKDPRIDLLLSRTDLNLIRPTLLGYADQRYFYERLIKIKNQKFMHMIS